jgi:NAD-dependent deacetylase
VAKIVILSGAGISAESGIETFRDSDGLWEGYAIEKVATKGVLKSNRAEAIEFYDKRRLNLEDKKPNYAHKVVAELKNKYQDEIAVITQNVDNLFEKAGIHHDDITHLHGFLTELECEKCGLVYDIGYQKVEDSFNGKCPTCSSPKIRPNIVMFGEVAIEYKKLESELKQCELLVVIGTSGNVLDVNTMVRSTPSSILNNLEANEYIDDSIFTKVLYKKATEAIEEIKEEIVKLVKQKYYYQCGNCKAEYMFYKELDGFDCTVCMQKINMVW